MGQAGAKRPNLAANFVNIPRQIQQRRRKKPPVETVEQVAQITNELTVLLGHEDLIRCVLKIDQHRFASGSDDCSIIIWDYEIGRMIFKLEGHKLPITCLLVLDGDRILSGSVDKTLRIWDIHTGTCVNTLTGHEGSVKCLRHFHTRNSVVSAANDNHLRVWDLSAGTNSTILRQQADNVNCLEVIGGQSHTRIAVGSQESRCVVVYNPHTLEKQCDLAEVHRESVNCLQNISDKSFASGSLDGSIIVWDAEKLTMLSALRPQVPVSDLSAAQHCSVNQLRMVEKRYLAAAVGKGFALYDSQYRLVLNVTDSHEAKVLSVISLYDGSTFLTADANARIKIWTMGKSASQRYPELKQAVHVQELTGHSGAVLDLLPLNDSSFASIGFDHLILLWKDGRVEAERRNMMAMKYLLRMSGYTHGEGAEFQFDEELGGETMTLEVALPRSRTGTEDQFGD